MVVLGGAKDPTPPPHLGQNFNLCSFRGKIGQVGSSVELRVLCQGGAGGGKLSLIGQKCKMADGKQPSDWTIIQDGNLTCDWTRIQDGR